MSFFVPTNALRAVTLRLPHEKSSCFSSDGNQAPDAKSAFREKGGTSAEVCHEKNRFVGEEVSGNPAPPHLHSSVTDGKCHEKERTMGCVGGGVSRFEDPTMLRNTRKWAQFGVPVPSSHLATFSNPTSPRHASSHPSSPPMPSLLDTSFTKTKKSTVYSVLTHTESRGMKEKDANDGIREEEEDVLTIISPSSSTPRVPPSHRSAAVCLGPAEAFHSFPRLPEEEKKTSSSQIQAIHRRSDRKETTTGDEEERRWQTFPPSSSFFGLHEHRSGTETEGGGGGREMMAGVVPKRTFCPESNAVHSTHMDWQEEFTFLYDAPTLLDAPTCTTHPNASVCLSPDAVWEGKHGDSMMGSPASDVLPADPEGSKQMHATPSFSSSSLPMSSASSTLHADESGAILVGASAAALRQIAEMRKFSGQESQCGPPKKKTASSSFPTTAVAAASESFFRKMKFSTKRRTAATPMNKAPSLKDGKKGRKTKTAEGSKVGELPSHENSPVGSTALATWKASKMGKEDRLPPPSLHPPSAAAATLLEGTIAQGDAFYCSRRREKKKDVPQTGKQKTKRSRASSSCADSSNGIRSSSMLSIPKASGTGENGDPSSPPFTTPSFSIDSIPQKVLTTHSEVEALWGRLERALLDPDRIQSPPLFAGVLFRSGSEWGSNFTEKIPEKEFRHLEAQKRALLHQKERWLSLVHGFGFRWQDEIYRMGCALGIHFLLRVLRDLRGVEVITYNAPLLVTPLLVATDGALNSTCISDVRVMGWMCAFFPPPVVSQYGSLRQAVLESGFSNPHSGGRIDVRSVVPPLHHLSESVHGAFPCTSSSSSLLVSSTSFSHSVLLPDAEARFVDDIFALAPLYRHMYGHMGAKGLLQPYLRQEKRISLLLAQMKFNGILVDLNALFQLKSSLQNEMESARKQAQELVSAFYPMGDFNIQSSDQCREVLYEHLNLGKHLGLHDSTDPSSSLLDAAHVHPPSNANHHRNITKKGKLSTAEETLRQLTPHHPLPGVIIGYRKAAKIIQTYIEGILQNAVVHTDDSSDMHGTSTCSEKGDAPQDSDTLQSIADGAEGSRVFTGATCIPAFRCPTVRADVTVGMMENGVERENCDAMTSQKVMLHPNFIHEGTETGRLSCVEPNLQNLPRIGNRGTTRRTTNAACDFPGDGACWEEGREEELGTDDAEEEESMRGIRSCFVAPEKHVLVSIDFDQIELRVLAHMSGDAALIEALSKQQIPSISSSCFSESDPRKTSLPNIDIHSEIAKKVFQKVLITPEERNLAKRIVFGTLYGAGASSMAAQLHVPIETVHHIIRGMQKSFPSLDSYRLKLIEEGRMNGFVRTLYGRIRYLPDLTSAVAARRSHAERQAFNTVVQGSAADVMKQAMLAVERKLLSLQPIPTARLQLQIHDELIFCLPVKDLFSMVPVLMEAMTSAVSLRVPLLVTTKYGPTLGSLSSWTVENELGLPSS